LKSSNGKTCSRMAMKLAEPLAILSALEFGGIGARLLEMARTGDFRLDVLVGVLRDDFFLPMTTVFGIGCRFGGISVCGDAAYYCANKLDGASALGETRA